MVQNSAVVEHPHPPLDSVLADVVVLRMDLRAAEGGEGAATLSDAERTRAARFAFDRDRRAFVTARNRLRRLLGDRVRVPPGDVELVVGEHGKPALGPRFADAGIEFNLSHAGDMVAYVFAAGCPVGIDIEPTREVADRDALAAHVLTARELAIYETLDERQRSCGFFNAWTRKEAVLKAMGAGLNRPLSDIEVSFTPGEPARILRIGETDGERCGWALSSFVPAPGFVGAVVVQAPTRIRVRRHTTGGMTWSGGTDDRYHVVADG